VSDTEDAAFEALWARVLEGWNDEKTHDAALSYALATEHLPDLGGRYRALLDDADKQALAKRKIDRIVGAATQLLMATKTAPRPQIPREWTLSFAALCVVVLGFLAYTLFRR
jgi:hypothetical protein